MAEGDYLSQDPWAGVLGSAEQQAGLRPGLLPAIAAQENVAARHNNPLGLSTDAGVKSYDPQTAIAAIMRQAQLMNSPTGPYAEFARTGDINALAKVYSPVGARNDPYGTNATEAAGIKAHLAKQYLSTDPNAGVTAPSGEVPAPAPFVPPPWVQPEGTPTEIPTAPLNVVTPQGMDFGPAAVAQARERMGLVPKSAGQAEMEIAKAQDVALLPKEVLPPYWYSKALQAALPESKTAQAAAGFLEGEAKLGSGLTTPGMISMAAGLAPVAGSKLAQTALAAVFEAQGIKATPQQITEIKDAYNKGDWKTVGEKAVEVGAEHLFPLVMAGDVAFKGAPEVAAKAAEPKPEVAPAPTAEPPPLPPLQPAESAAAARFQGPAPAEAPAATADLTRQALDRRQELVNEAQQLGVEARKQQAAGLRVPRIIQDRIDAINAELQAGPTAAPVEPVRDVTAPTEEEFFGPEPTKPAAVTGPALVDPQGKVIAQGQIGDTHADLMKKAVGTPQEDAAVEALGNDAQHGFVDEQGNVLDRNQGATAAVANGQAPEGTTKLQSEQLKPKEVVSATQERQQQESDIGKHPRNAPRGAPAETGGRRRVEPSPPVTPQEAVAPAPPPAPVRPPPPVEPPVPPTRPPLTPAQQAIARQAELQAALGKPKPKVEAKPPTAPGEPQEVGVAERYREEQQPGSVTPGTRESPEYWRQQGRDYINKGGDPRTSIRKAQGKMGTVSPADVGRVAAKYEQLAEQTHAAAQKVEANPRDANARAALDAATQAQAAWSKEMQPVLTRAGEALAATQGKMPVDETTFSGLYTRMLEYSEGRPPTKGQQVEAMKRTQKVSKAKTAEQQTYAKMEKAAPGKAPTEAEMRARVADMVKKLTPCD